jgi:hypothetical protein
MQQRLFVLVTIASISLMIYSCLSAHFEPSDENREVKRQLDDLAHRTSIALEEAELADKRGDEESSKFWHEEARKLMEQRRKILGKP